MLFVYGSPLEGNSLLTGNWRIPLDLNSSGRLEAGSYLHKIKPPLFCKCVSNYRPCPQRWSFYYTIEAKNWQVLMEKYALRRRKCSCGRRILVTRKYRNFLKLHSSPRNKSLRYSHFYFHYIIGTGLEMSFTFADLFAGNRRSGFGFHPGLHH